MRKGLIFTIIPLLLIVPGIAFAVDYEYNGYTPKWAIPLDDDQALNMCSYITSPGDEKKWCDSFGLYLTELWKLTHELISNYWNTCIHFGCIWCHLSCSRSNIDSSK